MARDYAGRGSRNGNRGRGGAKGRGGNARRAPKRANGRKRQAPASRRAPAPRRAGIPGWVWLFCGVTVGLVLAMGAYIATRPVGRHMSTVEQTLSTRVSPKPAGNAKQPAPPPKSKPRFSFYEMLPNYEVVIPKERNRSPAQKAHPQVDQGGTYVIQVASFKQLRSANAEKAKLALLGIESQIQKSAGDNGTTWYRVRVGPSQDTQRLNRVLSLLKQNNVDSLVMRVRQNG